jgi:hypothetical protein
VAVMGVMGVMMAGAGEGKDVGSRRVPFAGDTRRMPCAVGLSLCT